MRMESFWRWLGVALGKYWKVVAAVVTLITLVFAIGAQNIEFATGQDSYLNPDSQIAIDNVAFQDDFGGETVILLFSSTDGSDISELYEGENLAELERITAEQGPRRSASPPHLFGPVDQRGDLVGQDSLRVTRVGRPLVSGHDLRDLHRRKQGQLQQETLHVSIVGAQEVVMSDVPHRSAATLEAPGRMLGDQAARCRCDVDGVDTSPALPVAVSVSGPSAADRSTG